MRCANSEPQPTTTGKRVTARGATPCLLAALLVFSGCQEIQITTRIEPNGSLERIIIVEGDSSGVEAGYPIPDDPSWSVEIVAGPEEEDSKPFLHTFRKRFRSVRALNREIAGTGEPELRITSRAELTRRYRWFSTILTYRERYEPYYPFRTLPLADHFTAEEIETIRHGEADSILENRAEHWMIRNYFEDLFESMLRGAERLNDPDLTPAYLTTRREELYNSLITAADEEDLDDLQEVIMNISRDIYKTDAVDGLRPEVEDFQRRLNEYEAFESKTGGETYKHTVVMPGLILDTNASEIEGNSVTWELSNNDAVWLEYEMWVQSRVTNRWVIGFAIVILAALVAGVVVLVVKR
jgi:hypothetical protein